VRREKLRGVNYKQGFLDIPYVVKTALDKGIQGCEEKEGFLILSHTQGAKVVSESNGIQPAQPPVVRRSDKP
jgi:hypothetical protein